MMNFRTTVPIGKNPNSIDYTSKIVSLGSCFAVNMSEKLDFFKFQNSCNTFGILFHPLAIEKIISKVVNNEQFTDVDIFFHNEQWHCFDVHSELSNSNKEELLQNLNQKLKTTNQQITDSSHIIITYGTAWVYRSIDSNSVVGNCHKVPQKQFSKEILSVETCGNAIQNTLDLIQKINPNCNFIFTISPVRHIKDGFVENQQSKSHLITALHETLQNNRFKQNTEYFPSYEIMMDELRDYRFYAEDMLHPNQVAIDYIWQQFSENYIAEIARQTMKEIDGIQSSLKHRSFNPESQQHLQFLSKLQEKIVRLQDEYPFIEF